MTMYRITLLSPDESVERMLTAEYRDDDHALERAGKLPHPHRILVHQGERLVGDFQPVAGHLSH
jgi:hypothetical protein